LWGWVIWDQLAIISKAYLFHELATADDGEWGQVDLVGKSVWDGKFQLPGTSFPQTINARRPNPGSDMGCRREEHMWNLAISYHLPDWHHGDSPRSEILA
jgi:hypothetical protein